METITTPTPKGNGKSSGTDNESSVPTPTREDLRTMLKAKVNNSRISRASLSVRQEKMDKIKADLDKILESTGIKADDFIKSMAGKQ